MDPLRILCVTSSLGIGGAEHHVLDLCRFLSRAGHASAVCTISPREDGLEAAFLLEGIPLFRMPIGSLSHLARPSRLRALRDIIRRFNPDIVHGHLYHGEVAAAAASLFSRLALLATRHSAGIEFLGGHRLAARLLARRFDAIVAVSAEAAREAVDLGCRRERVHTIPNAVDTGRFKPLDDRARSAGRRALLQELFPADPTDASFLAGAVGGLRCVKNFPLFVRAAAQLAGGCARPGSIPGSRFVIVGEGPERSALERLAADEGLGGRLAFAGARRDLEALYPLLDCFVLTSDREGVPLALLEAMSSGVACVASDVGGVRDTLGDAGALVLPGDEDGFVRAVAILARDTARRRELGRLSRVRALERYDVSIWGERMLDLYRSVLAKHVGR